MVILLVGRDNKKLEVPKKPLSLAILLIYCFSVGLDPNLLSCYLSPMGLGSADSFLALLIVRLISLISCY